MRISSSRFDSRGRGRGRGFGGRHVRQSPLLNSRTKDYPSGFKDSSKFGLRSRSRSPPYSPPFIKKDEYPRNSSWERRDNLHESSHFMEFSSRPPKDKVKLVKLEKHHDLAKIKIKRSLSLERSPLRRHTRPMVMPKDSSYHHSRSPIPKSTRSWSRSPPPPPKYSKSHSGVRRDFKLHKTVRDLEEMSSHRPVFHGPEGSIIDERELKKITININRKIPRRHSPSTSTRFPHSGDSGSSRRSDFFPKFRTTGSESSRSYDYYPSKDEMIIKSSHSSGHSSVSFGRPTSGRREYARESDVHGRSTGHSSRSKRSSSYDKETRNRDLRERINEKRTDPHEDELDMRSKINRRKGLSDERYTYSGHHSESSKPMFSSRKVREDDRYATVSSSMVDRPQHRSFDRSADRSYDHSDSRGDWSQDITVKKYSSYESDPRRDGESSSRGFRGSGLRRRRPRGSRSIRGFTRGHVFKRDSPSRRSKQLTPDF